MKTTLKILILLQFISILTFAVGAVLVLWGLIPIIITIKIYITASIALVVFYWLRKATEETIEEWEQEQTES